MPEFDFDLTELYLDDAKSGHLESAQRLAAIAMELIQNSSDFEGGVRAWMLDGLDGIMKLDLDQAADKRNKAVASSFQLSGRRGGQFDPDTIMKKRAIAYLVHHHIEDRISLSDASSRAVSYARKKALLLELLPNSDLEDDEKLAGTFERYYVELKEVLQVEIENRWSQGSE